MEGEVKRERGGRKVMSSNKGGIEPINNVSSCETKGGRKEASNGAKHLGQSKVSEELPYETSKACFGCFSQRVGKFWVFALALKIRRRTASLTHLRTMLPESSSCPQPAQWPNHAT